MSRMTNLMTSFVGLFCLAIAGSALGAVQYTMTELGFPPGQTGGFPPRAVAAGGMVTAMSGAPGIYVWNGGYTLVAGPGNSLYDVSRLGTVAGYVPSGGEYLPVYWTLDGTRHDITSFRSYGMAWGINDKGLMTGYTNGPGDSSYGKRAFLHNPTSSGPTSREFAVLDLNGDGDTSQAYAIGTAINSQNVVVGLSIDKISARMFAWDETAGLRSIGFLTSVYTGLQPRDISSSNIVVGDYNNAGFVMPLGGAFTTLSQPAYGVNQAGMVVGSANMFYYQGVEQSINSLVTNAAGRTVTEMAGINDLGVIFGRARRPDNSYVPIMLEPVMQSQKVAGGGFDDMGDWTPGGAGSASIVSDPDDPNNNVLQMITGSPVYVSQDVDTPPGDFLVAFDYWFQTTTGTLELSLGGESLLTLDAASSETECWIHGGVIVNDPSLMSLNDAALTFLLDDQDLPGDATVYLDNVSLGLVPEPLTPGLLASGSLPLLRRRRQSHRKA